MNTRKTYCRVFINGKKKVIFNKYYSFGNADTFGLNGFFSLRSLRILMQETEWEYV